MTTPTERIRELNDAFRQTFTGGLALFTPGIAALGARAVDRIVKTIAVYDDFCRANDPYEEHDFGAFEAEGETIFFKIDYYDRTLFGVIKIIVRVAPLGAFGAMAFTVGAFGVESLRKLVELILTFYFTSILFVLAVLGTIAHFTGFSILRFIGYIKDELLIVVGTSSSETVLPQMIQKMQRLGASKSVVGLVIPTGYSFNLDGTNIYMTLATLFLAQATNTPLTIGQELGILLIAMITSKGASGVTGAGFVTLAATLAIVPDIPIQSLAILLGIDKFMSECRALTNLIGNGVATLVISRWEGELDADKLHEAMAHPVALGEQMELKTAV